VGTGHGLVRRWVFVAGGMALLAGAVAVPDAPAFAQPSAAGSSQAGVISTVAGGVGGPAKATQVASTPCGVTYLQGYLYVAAGKTVRKVSTGTDGLTTPVGTGSIGPVGNGGPASRASVNTCSVTTDAAGNLVIANSSYNTVQVVAATTGVFYGQAMTAGVIYAVAGDGVAGFSGDGGPATEAELRGPDDVAVDGSGNLVIADSFNNRVRVVAAVTGTFYGQAMTAGDIYTVAGDGKGGFTGDGGPATGAELAQPAGVSTDGTGNLVIADSFNNRVRVVAASNGTFYGQAMTAGDIYTIAGDGTPGFAGDGGPATGAELAQPSGVSTDGAGNLVIADSTNDRVRVVAASNGTFYGQPMTAGDIYTVAGDPGANGDGGPATGAELAAPDGITADHSGDLLIADPYAARVRMVASSTGTFFGQAMTAGDIYTVAGDGISGYSGDGGPATSAEIWYPGALTVDHAGNLVIPDEFNYRVRVVAASSGTFYGQKMTAGDIYTVAGDGTEGYSGDKGPAIRAALDQPSGVAADSAGNLVIADWGDNHVRVVAVKTGTFYGQKMTAGDIYTIAGVGKYGFNGDGGPAAKAELTGPDDVAVDSSGNLVITDSGNERVRVIAARTGTFYGQKMTAGDIYTVAGDGGYGFSGDGGPATKAELNDPYGIAVDGTGNLVVADYNNYRVRVVATRTGTFYGQKMTAGDIYTVAGDGGYGFSGDGGPGSSAELTQTADVAVSPAGDLLIADVGNGRIRSVTG
jgi:trimeric autotransporter adhesin